MGLKLLCFGVQARPRKRRTPILVALGGAVYIADTEIKTIAKKHSGLGGLLRKTRQGFNFNTNSR